MRVGEETVEAKWHRINSRRLDPPLREKSTESLTKMQSQFKFSEGFQRLFQSQFTHVFCTIALAPTQHRWALSPISVMNNIGLSLISEPSMPD